MLNRCRVMAAVAVLGLLVGTGTAQEPGGAFVVGGWIPYGRKAEGCGRVLERLDRFTQVSPFAFEMKKDGTLEDRCGLGAEPWTTLIKEARRRKVLVVPTVLATDAEAMHAVLSDPERRQAHVEAIVGLVEAGGYDGVDIDYEGKDVADREYFSAFIAELAAALKAKGRYLSATIEARTRDDPPAGFTGTRAMAWANDLAVLNKYCDTVRVMAYDQYALVNGAKEWQDDRDEMRAPLAELGWVEKVVDYLTSRIEPDKLVLGIPTYGVEFAVSGEPEKWKYKQVAAVSYPEAVEIARAFDGVRQDTGGELQFSFRRGTERRLLTYTDHLSIGEKVTLARDHGLAGVCFFKMDGLEPPKMWTALENPEPSAEKR